MIIIIIQHYGYLISHYSVKNNHRGLSAVYIAGLVLLHRQ